MQKKLPSTNMLYYVDQRTMDTVYRALGLPLTHGLPERTHHSSTEDQEEVVEEVDNDL